MIKTAKIALIICCVALIGCRSSKRIASEGELDRSISAKEVVKNHKRQHANFKTLQSKVKVEYIQGNQSQSHTITLRMERGKAIWINSAFSVVRAMITPEKVGYYNKLDNTYFDGDFQLISNLLGTEVDFNHVQNMILGEALYELDDNYAVDTHEESYVLSPSDQSTIFEIFFLVNPSHFKMDSQQIAQPLDQRLLQVDYEAYQEVGRQILPQKIKVIALEADSETIISMEFKSISLNGELRFPFRIPSGYDPIETR